MQQALQYRTSLGTWLVVTTLSGFAIIMLPRQFHVTIVENRSESELATAAWVFPTYLVAINLFVIPLAFAGATLVGDRTSADLYVLSLPLFNGHDILAMAAFIGGLSAATAMVIVASVALSIMISNDLVIPLFLRGLLKRNSGVTEDWSSLILNIRRAAIFVVLFVAFLYYRESTNNARLASIGLMSFAAIAQFGPAFFGGLIWRGANARGAALGMSAGILVWAYTLLLPSLAAPDASILSEGLFGVDALRPQALFGTIAEPLNHGVLWSLAINTVFYVLGSLSRASIPLERIQASIFVPRDAGPMPQPQALSHHRHHRRPQGHDRPLSRRRAHRAVVPDFRDQRRRQAGRPRAGEHGADPLLRTAAGQRGRLGLGAADPVAAVPAPRQDRRRTRSACSTTRPKRCSTTATCCRSRSTRWNRASPCSTGISG